MTEVISRTSERSERARSDIVNMYDSTEMAISVNCLPSGLAD